MDGRTTEWNVGQNTLDAQAQRQKGMQAPEETSMQHLSGVLFENRKRLRDMMSLIEDRLDRFDPTPRPASGESANEPDHPTPGSLPGLRHIAETTSADLQRLDAICLRLQKLL